MPKSSDDKKLEATKAIMAKLAAMPHKPHTAKKGKKPKANPAKAKAMPHST